MKLSIRFFENADKRERRRRRQIHERGRLGEAYVTGFDEAAIYYSYSVGGAQYEASQDISAVRDRLPAPPERLLGVARLKYLPNNPANSILLSEDWCGLQPRQPVE